ncbi:RICIN domain-containing protein [Methylocystis echinoides]|uniref:RICIN domain-containing protein n=1 Tax=Methylocystis echinoides TaxID=29468 RepID=UPI003425118A
MTRIFGPLVIAAFLLILGGVAASAQSCRWDGTAPFCGGECSGGEQEMARLSTWPGHWTPVIVNPAVNHFGSACVTGTKALCCRTGLTCRWDGTAPFCDGECRSNETQSTPPPGSSSGSSCWTGSKVYCCSRVGTTSSPLGVAPIIVSGARKCLDVHAPDQHVNGAKVQVWDCNYALQQTWRFDGQAIKSGAGKCLDVHAPDQFMNGAKVQVWDCNNSMQQTWRIEGQAIKSGAGKCLDVHAPDQFTNGGKVQVWDCNNSTQQTWFAP